LIRQTACRSISTPTLAERREVWVYTLRPAVGRSDGRPDYQITTPLGSLGSWLVGTRVLPAIYCRCVDRLEPTGAGQWQCAGQAPLIFVRHDHAIGRYTTGLPVTQWSLTGQPHEPTTDKKTTTVYMNVQLYQFYDCCLADYLSFWTERDVNFDFLPRDACLKHTYRCSK